jgi:hypothetical protein
MLIRKAYGGVAEDVRSIFDSAGSIVEDVVGLVSGQPRSPRGTNVTGGAGEPAVAPKDNTLLYASLGLLALATVFVVTRKDR